ncbi:MAG TPA: hypothetical protein EYP04_02790 [Anaerolineae bacterium]|nr:hypothetical protein [Anaerolineae bacterium]
MDSLSHTERKILAVLEEAGEDDVHPLINTVNRPKGHPHEVTRVVDALFTLQHKSLVEFEKLYYQGSWKSVHLSPPEAAIELQELAKTLRWSPERQLWIADASMAVLRVLLTPTGMAVAERLLREHGWDLVQPD